MEEENDVLIKADNLGKVFLRNSSAPVKALEGVNLEAHRGEFLVIVGRSGSGKTTLLNLLGALDRPSTGEIKFEGKNLGKFSNRELALLRREKIGFIFQTFNLLPSLTVFENIESGLVHSLIPQDQAHRRIREFLDVLELTEMCNRLPLELSVGQQQKVAVARAIIKNPALILADEPTGEMDPIAGKEIMEKMNALTKKARATLVIASHGTSMVSDADRSLFLKSGRIVSREESGY